MTYVPISCSIHDHLEAAATLRRPVTLSYAGPDGVIEATGEVIQDVYARGGVEYVRLGSGLELRLDLLISLNGMQVRSP